MFYHKKTLNFTHSGTGLSSQFQEAYLGVSQAQAQLELSKEEKKEEE
jgi:hypothetical protein